MKSPRKGHAHLLPRLRRFLPAQNRLGQRRSSLDLPDHRQMAACLRAWAAWLAASAELLDRASGWEDTEERRAAAT